MKLKYMRRFLLCGLIAAIALAGTGITEVYAGKSGGYVVGEDYLKGNELSKTEWKFDEESVRLENDVLIFDENYDLESPVLIRSKAYASPEIRAAVDGSFRISIQEWEGDKKFGMLYGLARLDGDVGDEGTTFIYFKGMENGIGVGIETFQNGQTVELLPLTYVAETLQDALVNVKISCQGSLSVVVAGQLVYAGEDGETVVEGHVGFSSLGSWTSDSNYMVAHISDFVVYNEYYAKPETPLLTVADFNGNEFNTNEWTLKSTKVSGGSGLVATDGVLKFDGSGQNATFATQHQYSNFEIQYDIFDAKNTTSIAADGRTVGATYWQQVSWGMGGDSAEGVASFYGTRYAIIFDAPIDHDAESETYGQRTGKMSAQLYIDSNYVTSVAVPEKYAFLQPGFDDTVRVCVNNVDGQMVLSLKLKDEAEFTEIMRYAYKNGMMDTGYIVLRGEGNQYTDEYQTMIRGSYYSIDNIIVKNFDKNPTIKKVDFTSNIIPPVPDYDYTDPYTDSYLITHTGGKPSK